MIISKKPDNDKKVKILIDGETLEQVKEFKYLWSQVTEDARIQTELNCKIGAAKTKLSRMSIILISKHLRIALKVRFLKCYNFSVFIYGSKAWTLTTPMENKIDAFGIFHKNSPKTAESRT